MVAIVTGDLIHSAKHPAQEWLDPLKTYLSRLGGEPREWELYRGDELQIRLQPAHALHAAIELKAYLISNYGLDIRMALGLGTEEYRAPRVSQSNGPAYRRSGQVFETLKIGKSRIRVSSGNASADRSMNLILKLASQIMDHWTQVSAEICYLALQQPEASQTELAAQLGIRQSAVSQRQKRARLDLVEDVLAYYQEEYLKQLS